MLVADASGWVTAIATSVAAVAAVVAGFFAYRAFGKELEQVHILELQEGDRRLDRRRAQAATVFAIVRSTDTRPDGTSAVSVTVRNLSLEPVWSCAVIVKSDWGLSPKARQVQWIEVLPPAEDHGRTFFIRLTETRPIAAPNPPVELSF